MTVARLLPLMVVAVALAGCQFSPQRAVGERCDATRDCEVDLECVVVDNGDSFCLPRPAGREERPCSSDDDCILSDGQLWPLETECLDGQCRCLGSEIDCDPERTSGLLLQEETCRCIPLGNEGDTCITSHTCDIGLACTGGECRSAVEQEGSACLDSSDCSEATRCSEFRDNNDVGVCR